MLEDILSQVNKPGRYIGGEWNASKKDFAQAGIKFALCFPDLYEVGMSNLGIRIIYGILNSLADVSCERLFSPGVDMEGVLRAKDLEIFSLESKRKLKEFDLVGFSLGHELNYTNVLNMLNLGGLPLKSSDRDCQYPLVIGGGPCALNPEPLSDFFDLFLIGEAEDAILEIVDAYRKHKEEFKTGRINKQELLRVFSGIEGVYAPALYEVTYDSEGKIKEFKSRIQGLPCKVKKRIVRNLDNAYFPLDWLIPHIAIIHDRITLEAMRGCPNTCRFCQARSQYFPLRQRKVSSLLDLAAEIYRRSGYEEISLAGLSVSDYSGIEDLVKALIDTFKAKGVGVSLPSIRPKTIVGELSRTIATIKKTGLTFAPEAASERLRQSLGKDFDLQNFWLSIQEAKRLGWRHIKLYFMIGLPGEEQGDLDAILGMANDISKLISRVNISISSLIPKPHTPFQWLGVGTLENIKDKQEYLKKKANNRRLKLSFHNCDMSFLEGVLSRGDRRLGEVILGAFKKGARFDAWENFFAFDKWQEAFGEANIDPVFYLKAKAKDEVLPWDFIDVGIDKEVLRAEFDKTIAIK